MLGALASNGVKRLGHTNERVAVEIYTLSAPLGGGALMDVGCYCVNVARSLAGAQPIAVQALATWRQGVDETLSATLEFENGLTARIDCAFGGPRYENDLSGQLERLA